MDQRPFADRFSGSFFAPTTRQGMTSNVSSPAWMPLSRDQAVKDPRKKPSEMDLEPQTCGVFIELTASKKRVITL
jgi:hypothetical protein